MVETLVSAVVCLYGAGNIVKRKSNGVTRKQILAYLDKKYAGNADFRVDGWEVFLPTNHKKRKRAKK